MFPTVAVSLLATVTALTGLHFSPWFAKRRAISRLSAGCRRDRLLCLTYDDGPGGELTAAILDLLGGHNAVATFFLLGIRTPRQETLLDRLQHEGHEIGTHSQRHLNAWKVWPWQAVADVRAGFACVQRRLPGKPLFRPPHGKLVFSTAREVRRQGARLAWWTHDSGDTWARLPSPDLVVGNVRGNGGGVVLLHDFDRESVDRVARHTFVLTVTRALLEMASQDGLTIVPLGRLLNRQSARAAEGRTLGVED